jgi:hypothetical protein
VIASTYLKAPGLELATILGLRVFIKQFSGKIELFAVAVCLARGDASLQGDLFGRLLCVEHRVDDGLLRFVGVANHGCTGLLMLYNASRIRGRQEWIDFGWFWWCFKRFVSKVIIWWHSQTCRVGGGATDFSALAKLTWCLSFTEAYHHDDCLLTS